MASITTPAPVSVPSVPNVGLPTATPATATGSSTANASVTAQNAAATGSSAGTASQANAYSAGQVALQNQLNSILPGYLSGTTTVPTAFTTPGAAQIQSLNNQLNNQTNPAIAAQYGAGSPQIGAQDALAQTNLAAQTYQAGIQQYLSALGLAGNTAYTAQGQNTANQGTTASNTSQIGTTAGLSATQYGTSLLGLLLGSNGNASPGGGGSSSTAPNP